MLNRSCGSFDRRQFHFPHSIVATIGNLNEIIVASCWRDTSDNCGVLFRKPVRWRGKEGGALMRPHSHASQNSHDQLTTMRIMVVTNLRRSD